jgi:RNA polymerase sigma-70 factor (ECF subfamily)
LNKKDLIKEFTELIEKNQGIIYKVSGMYCNGTTCREDLFQETLLQLWRAFPSYDRNRKFSTWMYRIAINTAISQFREEKSNIVVYKSEVPEQIYENRSYEGDDNISVLNRAIRRLNKAEKAIIILYMDNHTYEDISEIIGITVSHVGVKINRIKKKLQKHLEELGYEF